MCHQRERLIGYIYSEGEPRERDEVQQHLDTCVDCRAEVAGLRAVREDLLAWNVPDHESVWRPFAPAPVTPWWRQVPSWAMAAAASVMVVSGAVGGVVAHAFVGDQGRTVVSQPIAAPAVTATVSAADLSALEQRWLARLRSEIGAVDARVPRVSGRLQSGPAGDGNREALTAEVLHLRSDNQKLVEVVNGIYANMDQIRKEADFKYGLLESKYNNLQAILQLQVK